MAHTYIIGGGEEEKKPLPTPAAGPRPDEGPMKKDTLQALFDGLVNSSIQFTDAELSPKRALATNYYMGRPFGNEEPGRSQVVITEVRDGVLGAIPGALRVVFGSERPVEAVPKGPEDVPGAEQATDYLYETFTNENDGFLATLAVFKDGLVRGQGTYKWWWDEYNQVEQHSAENVSEEGMMFLASDDEVKITRAQKIGEEDGPPGPDGQPTKVALYDIEFTRTAKDGCAKFAAVPPEELCYNREARSIEEATIIFHRTQKTHGELVAMGIDKKVVAEKGTAEPDLAMNEENISRSPSESVNDEEDAGKANQKTRYIEAYVRLDYDGDGIAELRKICAIGAGNHIVHNDPVEDIPFAIFCPDPEPHTMTGLSYADRLMDMQKVKSSLMRAGLDSLAASIFPRTWYKEGDANLADVLNTQIGAPIRTKSGMNAVGEFAHTFTGKEAFTALEYCDEIIERRTGRNKGTMGLDADALQSSTQQAVAAAVTSSQAQEEMMVRIFCETALKRLFKGLFKLLVKHQPRAKMIRLRNQWVEIDPRTWNADMDVRVNVALGSGLVEQKIQTLLGIAEKQKEIIAEMGPHNPVCTIKNYRDTLAEIAELSGKKNSDRYFLPISDEQEKKMAEDAANQPPPKTPEQQIAEAQIQIEQMKAQATNERELMKAKKDLMLRQADLALKLKETQMTDDRERINTKLEDDRERDKMSMDMAMKKLDLELKYQVKVAEQQMKAEGELIRHSLAAEPAQEQPAEEGEAPAAKPKRTRRHVQVLRHDDSDPKSPIRGAIVEDEEVE